MIRRFEAEVRDARDLGAVWSIAYEGHPLPSALPQCFLSLPLADWLALDADVKRRAVDVVEGRARLTGRELRWRVHPMRPAAGAPLDVISVGPVAYDGELHRDVARLVPRRAGLFAFDPIRGASVDPRPKREKPAKGMQAAAGDLLRVVGFRGMPEPDALPAFLAPVVTDPSGRFADFEGEDAGHGDVYDDAGALPGGGVRVGPWCHTEGHVLLALHRDDVKRAHARHLQGARTEGRVADFLWAAHRGSDQFEGLLAAWPDDSPGTVVWYTSVEEALSLRRLLNACFCDAVWRAVDARDSAALRDAALGVLRVMVDDKDGPGAVAALALSGMDPAEVTHRLAFLGSAELAADHLSIFRRVARLLQERWDRSAAVAARNAGPPSV